MLARRLFSMLAIFVLIAGVMPVGSSRAQEGCYESEPPNYNYCILFAKQVIKLRRDGRGDVDIELTIKNVGSAVIYNYVWSWADGSSNIYATDLFGPLRVTVQRSIGNDPPFLGMAIGFRRPLAPGDSNFFILHATVDGMASITGVNGYTGDLMWHSSFYFLGVVFPEGTTFNSINPTPTFQTSNYLEWDRRGVTIPPALPPIDVYFTLPATTEIEPFLSLPIDYDGYPFERAVTGIKSENNGLVTSWFDHTFPDYNYDASSKFDYELTPWNGKSVPDLDPDYCDFGVNCYSGHNGIDWQNKKQNQPIYSAAEGTVREVCIEYIEHPLDSCSRSSLYGRYVVIDHHNGYATFYAHLESISVKKDQNISRHFQIGVMGNTTTGDTTDEPMAIHLHFGLYYDTSSSPTWSESKAVDPFGWQPSRVDDATAYTPPYQASKYMWEFPKGASSSFNLSGGTLFTPSRTLGITIPPNALSSELTISLFHSPAPIPVFPSSSLGYSFELQALGWLGGIGLQSYPEFNVPITLSVSYSTNDVEHIDESSLQIMQWNGASWLPLATTLDTYNKIAYATTIQTGTFDLQGNVACTNDSTEPDDNTYSASILGSLVVNKSFDSLSDEDWFVVKVLEGGAYTFGVDNLAVGVNAELYLYDDYGNLVTYDGDSSSINVTLNRGLFYLKVVPSSGSASGCSATYGVYMLNTKALFHIYLPLVQK